MIYVIRIYLCPPKDGAVIGAIRDVGMLLRRRFPELIAIDLLHSRSWPGAYLSIEFWTSEEAWRRATDSPAAKDTSRRLKDLASCVDLGAFAFPVPVEIEVSSEVTSGEPVNDCVAVRNFENA